MQTFCVMDKLRNYNIIFSGLPLGKSDFEFDITQTFFDLFQFEQEFTEPKVTVKVTLDKQSSMLELHFDLQGTVVVDCDLTNEPYPQEIKNTALLVVKFGEEWDDSDDEIWVIPREEYQLNIAQIVYELILLSIPTKHIHPDVLKGDSHSELLAILDQYIIEEVETEQDDPSEDDDDDDDEIDPRWAKLKDLKP